MKQMSKEKLSLSFPSELFNWANNQKHSLKGNIFQELHRFKEELDTAPNNLYELHKRHANVYRSIFGFLSLLFLGLATVLFFQKACGVLFIFYGNCMVVKNFLFSLSCLLTVTSAAIAYYIRPEREAVWHVARQAVRELTVIYMHRCSQWGWQRFFPFFPSYDKASILKLSFRKALDRVKEARGNALVLIEKIANSKNLDVKNRITLFNQAIQELKEKLERISIE